MNIPRLLTPVERRMVREPQKGAAAISAAAVHRTAGVRPAGALADPCHNRCRSIRSDSGYNLCVQLCRTPALS